MGADIYHTLEGSSILGYFSLIHTSKQRTPRCFLFEVLNAGPELNSIHDMMCSWREARQREKCERSSHLLDLKCYLELIQSNLLLSFNVILEKQNKLTKKRTSFKKLLSYCLSNYLQIISKLELVYF